MATRKTKLMSGFVALLMLVSMLAMFVIPASAAEVAGGIVAEKGLHDATSYPDITAYADGTTVYSIKDRAGMEKLANLVNNGTYLSGVTIYQIADIDMQNIPFEGIGYGDTARYFSGTFDGNGFTIDNLYVYRGSNSYRQSVALFGSAKSATFKNIGISGGLIVGSQWTGSLVGRGQYCKIINCWNAATVVGTSAQGTAGIAATNISGSSCNVNTYNVGLVYSDSSKASGIVGWINNANDKVVSCYNAGEIVSGITAYAQNAEGQTVAPVVCQALNQERGTANANNYYIKGRGFDQSSYELIQSGATTIPGTETALNGTHDAAIGLEATALTDGSLAEKLNAGFASEGNIDGYTIAFEQVEGVGYPVLTYRKDGEIVAQRYAKDNTNVNGAQTWKDNSPLFASFHAMQDGAGLEAGLPTSLTISDPDDLFLLGILTYARDLKKTFNLTEIKLGADIDLAQKVINPNIKYGVPLANSDASDTNNGLDYRFCITFDGQNHVIKNWASYGEKFSSHSVAGFISVTNTGAVIKNVGFIDALSEYHYSWGGDTTGYIYPSLVVERAYGVTTIENVFATGQIVTDGIVNSNNNSGVFSTTWADNVTIKNCWSNVTAVENGAAARTVRTIGKLPTKIGDVTGNHYDGDVVNVYNFNTSTPMAGSDNNANTYEKTVGTDHAYGSLEAAYWLSNDGGMTQLYKVVDGDIVFATEADAARKVTVEKRFPDGTVAETIDEYYHPGDTVTIGEIANYTFDETTIPEGGTAESFTMPTEDVVLGYIIADADYTVAEGILAEYENYDPALFVEEEAVAKIIADAKAIVALKEQEQTSAVIEAAIDQTGDLAALKNETALTLKNTYPNYPKLSEREIYADLHDGKNWAISSREDWVEVTTMFNVEKNGLSGITLHLTNNVDMKNEAVAPAGTSNSVPFKGTLDGHGYYFENLLIELETDGTNRWIGLFGFSNGGATIKNLGIESGTIRVAKSGTTNETMIAAFIGETSGASYFYNLYNKATIEGGDAYVSASGIARMTGASVVDNCYNVGDIISKPSAGGYAGGISGYSRADAMVWNSFSAPKNMVSKISGALRYNGSNKENLFGNTYSAGYALDGQNTHATEAQYELNYSDYESGKLAWLLNSNYISGKGGTRVYYTNDPAAKTVSFGTEATQTRQITLVTANEEYYYLYAPQGSTVTLRFPATGNISYSFTGEIGSLDGDQFTVGAGDATIAIVYDGVSTAALENAIAHFDRFNTDYYETSDGRTLTAVIAEANAKLGEGTITAEEITAYVGLLTSGVELVSQVTVEDIKYRNVGHNGYLIQDYNAYVGATVAVYSIEDLQAVQDHYQFYTADMTVALKANLNMTADDMVNNLFITASIDGEGHTISGLNLTSAWLGNGQANMKAIRNVTFDQIAFKTSAWNAGSLWGQITCNDLLIENVKFTNSTFTKNNGANGFGGIIGQIPNNKKVTFKNVVMSGNTLNRDCSGQGNDGLLVGPNVGTLVIDGMEIYDNVIAGTSAKWGDGIICAEMTKPNNIIKNLLITRNTLTGSAPQGMIAGVYKDSVTLTMDNVVIADNTGFDNIPWFGVVGSPATPVSTNLLTDAPKVLSNGAANTVTTAQILSGEKLYELNNAGVAKTWVINDEGIASGTEGLPVKVTFVAEDEKEVTTDVNTALYTDVNGNLIGLTEDLLNAAIWEDEDALATKSFTEDTTVTGTFPTWFTAGNAEGLNGAEVTVPVTLNNNPGFIGAEISVTYDPNAMALTAVEKGDQDALIVPGTPVVGEDGKATVEIALIPADGDNPVEVTADCVIANLKFTLNNTVKGGDYTVEIAAVEVVDAENNALTIENGTATVTVKCDFKPVISDKNAKPEDATHYTACVCGETTDPVKCSEGEGWSYERVEPTVLETGSITASCAICGYSYSEVLPALTGFIIGEVSGNKGDSVKVPVTIKNNPGYVGAQFTVTYDPNALTLTGVEKGEAEIFAELGDPVVGEDGMATVNVAVIPVDDAGAPAEITTDIVIANLVFTVNNCGAAADHAITVDATDVVADGNVKIDVVSGTGKVTALGHQLEKNEAKDPTCTETGNNEYYTCSVCGKVYKDAEGKTETTVEAETIGSKGHEMTKTEAKEPTCTEAGNNEYYTCGTCGKVYKDAEGKTETTVEAETLAASGHEMTKTEAKEPTCTEAGNNEYYTCGTCGKVYKDAEGKTETTVEAETLDANGHEMTKTEAKEPTCTEDGNNEYYTCGTCGKVYKDAEGKTETTVEAETLAANGHEMTKTEAKEATCTEDGNNEYYTCGTCGKVYKDAEGKTETTVEAETIASDGHEMTQIPAKAPTLEAEGNNEYYYCEICGKYFKDAEGTIETTVEAEILPKLDYIVGDVNNDGRVSIADAVMAMRVAAGDTTVPETINLLAADVSDEGDTEDMQINTADVVKIMQYLVGTLEEL
ncbi:MAG: hypothetical protein IJ043_01715 [Clostridia bacterium]|nr:hypothetical protein [Clostridia bacterium]